MHRISLLRNCTRYKSRPIAKGIAAAVGLGGRTQLKVHTEAVGLGDAVEQPRELCFLTVFERVSPLSKVAPVHYYCFCIKQLD